MTMEKKDKKKVTDFEVKDASGAGITDGLADTSVGLAKTIQEIVEAPLRVIGRTIDGTVQGVKHGVDQSENPIEGVAKGVSGAVVGTLKGVVKGVQESAKKVGSGFTEVADGVQKVGETLQGKKRLSESEEDKH